MSERPARAVLAALHLLDHQLIDRDGLFAGNVDDAEIRVDDDGAAYVAALITGPGALWHRFGRHRLGRWLRAHVSAAFEGEEDDPGRIPLRWVADVGASVRLNVRRDAIATYAVERWVRDHIIGHIPGSAHDVDE